MEPNIYRTHTCGELRISDVGKEVRIAGFVETIRDLGGLVFLDIRDMYGITQVVTSGETKMPTPPTSSTPSTTASPPTTS